MKRKKKGPEAKRKQRAKLPAPQRREKNNLRRYIHEETDS